MSLVPGTRIGHYAIVGSIGAGGMGEVYRATDVTLGRDIALKVLPAGMSRDPDRIERFQREARAVAALNHPHIVTIHSVEEAPSTSSGHAGVVHFLTMELVEGQSLDRHIPTDGVPVDTLLSMAVALSDALAAAHDKGIVHRDLKPANVMVTPDGRVKILDFGLAKVGASPSPNSENETIAQTSDGVVMGTMPYMSPEQIEGRPVDARTDLFSLGVVLHEMATGTRPFHGSSQAALVSSILRDAPASVCDRRGDMPPQLGRLIGRCLEKDRERRIQTAKDLRNELEELRRGMNSSGAAGRADAGAAAQRRSIVVLPFANLSPDADDEYFSDGLTEEIIADLSKVRALSVISRTSSMQLKGAKKNVRAIGRDLGVQYVLDGSVRKAGKSLRITAQLVDAASDAQLWSEKYSGTTDDVFEVQERVSREIVRALDITLTSDEHRRLGERPIADPRAFELFLQARQELRRYAVDRAMALIREAVRIEGETPALVALLTWSKVVQVRSGMSPDRAPIEEALRMARGLLARAPDAPYGHSMLGHIEYERGRLPEAVHHCRLALERETNDTDTLLIMCVSYVGAGQNPEARETARRMVACDPLSPISWMAAGLVPWFVGQPAQGIPDLQRALEIDPQNLIVHWTVGYAYALTGRLADAARHAQALFTMFPANPYTRQLLALLDGLEGRPLAALGRIASVDITAIDAHHAFHLAESYIAAGALDRGLDLLEQSVDGFYPYPYMAEYCPFLAPVRGLPRFAAVLATARDRAGSFTQREAALGA